MAFSLPLPRNMGRSAHSTRSHEPSVLFTTRLCPRRADYGASTVKTYHSAAHTKCCLLPTTSSRFGQAHWMSPGAASGPSKPHWASVESVKYSLCTQLQSHTFWKVTQSQSNADLDNCHKPTQIASIPSGIPTFSTLPFIQPEGNPGSLSVLTS